MKKYGILIASCISVLVALFLIYNFYRPRHIEVSLNSLIYSVDQNYERQTSLSITGEKHRYLSGKKLFLGKMIVDNDLTYDLKLEREDDTYMEILPKREQKSAVFETGGSIMLSTDFGQAWLQLDDINKRYNLKDGYLSGPASTLKEATDIAGSFSIK